MAVIYFTVFLLGGAFLLTVISVLDARKSAAKPEAPKPPNPCMHSFQPIDAQKLESDCIAHDATVLLQRCALCGDHRTAIFGGVWQISDFLKERADIAELERMMR